MTPLSTILPLVLVALVGRVPTADVPNHAAPQRDERLPLPEATVDADFHDDAAPLAARVELGRLLFFDKILSGNRNIACATCHHPRHASADGLALGLGEGPSGLGPERINGTDLTTAVHERVPRNAPALFNLGAREFTHMFHDGRVEVDSKGFYDGGFITPAKWKLPSGLDNVLAAQAMFPVTSPAEMAGQKGENEIADARSLNNVAGAGGVWALLADRLRAVPAYVEHFQAAFPERVTNPEDIAFVLAANAIAAFETSAFRADNSPFDRYLRGDESSLTPAAERGMILFYGKAACASCHAGPFQTDHDFHAIAMPQIGPGKSDGADPAYWRTTGHQAFLEDFGRGRVTARAEDRFKFRTPSLRNVAQTGPWGHAGTFHSLESTIRHHLDPVRSLEQFPATAVDLPSLERIAENTIAGSSLRPGWIADRRLDGFQRRDTWVQTNPTLRQRIADANELPKSTLVHDEIHDLVAFLESLTDSGSLDLDRLIPDSVPSGLPVAD